LVRKNTDKLSTSFLLARPDPHNSIPAIYFSEVRDPLTPDIRDSHHDKNLH
jgi:hypothetical protein